MRKRVTYIVTHGVTARILLRGQLRFLREHGYDVTVIASPGPDLDATRDREGVDVIPVSMSRSLRFTEGPRALVEMGNAIRKARPDLVNVSTAKAGLLGMLAATAFRVPRRVYLIRGTLIETRLGVARAALVAAERTTLAGAHHVVCVSESLRSFYRESGLLGRRPSSVIPSNGIDIDRFRPRAETRSLARDIRRQHGIPDDGRVVGFVGRLVADKGVSDMVAALERVAEANLDAHFLVVGGDLAGDSLPPDLERRLRTIPRVVFAGRVDEPAPYYAAMDVLLFPSYREGLPNVPLEAAACEVPAVGYDVTGVRDAIASGVTGIVVPFGDARALGDGLATYLRDEDRRSRAGAAARARVLDRFEQRRTWEAWLSLYERLLARPAPHSPN